MFFHKFVSLSESECCHGYWYCFCIFIANFEQKNAFLLKVAQQQRNENCDFLKACAWILLFSLSIKRLFLLHCGLCDKYISLSNDNNCDTLVAAHVSENFK